MRRRSIVFIATTSALFALFGPVAWAASGDQLWVKLIPGSEPDWSVIALALAISPDGSRLYVTGTESRPGGCDGAGQIDYMTIAYDPSNGTRLWTALVDGPVNSTDGVRDIAVSADGSKVFVTGSTRTDCSVYTTDHATVAYDAATGTQLWAAQYDGPAGGGDGATSIAPDDRVQRHDGVEEMAGSL
jgi:outer membrane protein assembly factor BamB